MMFARLRLLLTAFAAFLAMGSIDDPPLARDLNLNIGRSASPRLVVPRRVTPQRLRRSPALRKLLPLYDLAVKHYNLKQFDDAAESAAKYADGVRDVQGDSTPDFAVALSMQSRAEMGRGRYDDAVAFVTRAIEVRTYAGLHSKADYEDQASDLDCLAQLYQLQGRLEDAEPVFQRPIEAMEKAYDGAHANVGRTLNNMAWLYQAQGRYAEAEPLSRRSLDILSNLGPSERVDYGCALDTLAKIQEGQERFSEAEATYRKALGVLQKSLVKDDESIAATQENLGGLLKSRGRLRDASKLLR